MNIYKNLSEEERLVEEIRLVGNQIEIAKSRFDFESDDDLIEAVIYEIQALNARYRYLMKQAKSQNTKSTDIGALYVKSA